MALRLDEDRPPRFKPAQRVIEAASNSDKFSRYGAIKVRSPKFRRPLKRPILERAGIFSSASSHSFATIQSYQLLS
jgi:hypothetical protein